MGFWVFFTDDHEEYYDSDACKLFLIGKDVRIIRNSKKILDFLIENRNITMSQDQISEKLYGNDYLAKDATDTRSPVGTAISKLRRQLDKYSYVIETNSGFGYIYVGPELTPKSESAQKIELNRNKQPSSGSDRQDFSEINESIKTPSVEGANYMMANLRTALGTLIEANDINSINNARTYIRQTILDYIFNVAIDFERTDGDDWAREVERHTWLLNKEISSAQSEIMTRNQEPSIINIKQVILDAIRCFHIVTVFLSAQLMRERDALERAGDSIGKEIISSRINKIDFDYQSARDRENEAEKTVDNMIDNYTIGVTNDTPVI